jgi:hypothetical protein
MALNFANNNSLSAITTLPASISGGGMTLISEQTASGSDNISFTSGIDSTYDSYVFKFINIHGSVEQELTVNFSTDGGSNYNVTKTSTFFRSAHNEAGNDASIVYVTSRDLAQGTGNDILSLPIGNGSDESGSGEMTLYNPSSNTFVKHYIAQLNIYDGEYCQTSFVGGYGNTTSPINAVRFQMDSGNIDSGVIKLYGIS